MNFAKEQINNATLVQKYFEKFLLDFHQNQIEVADRISPYREWVKSFSDDFLKTFARDIVVSFRLKILLDSELENEDAPEHRALKEITPILEDKILEYLREYRDENSSLVYYTVRVIDKVSEIFTPKKEA